jgi:hypothetical protein
MMQQHDNIFTGMQNLPNVSHAGSPEFDNVDPQQMLVEHKLRQQAAHASNIDGSTGGMHGGTSSLMYLGGSDMNTSSQRVDPNESNVLKNFVADSKSYQKGDLSRGLKYPTSGMNSDNDDTIPN